MRSAGLPNVSAGSNSSTITHLKLHPLRPLRLSALASSANVDCGKLCNSERRLTGELGAGNTPAWPLARNSSFKKPINIAWNWSRTHLANRETVAKHEG